LAELFVSPSAYEGFGLTVADALAAGTPTVISNISSLPEVCGETAARIGELNAEGTADAIRPLLRNAAERRRLGAAGRLRAAEFCWEQTAEQTLAVYREALAR
jgi:alpha-1,3-rhamnosyl/mannosyltransferase